MQTFYKNAKYCKKKYVNYCKILQILQKIVKIYANYCNILQNITNAAEYCKKFVI